MRATRSPLRSQTRLWLCGSLLVAAAALLFVPQVRAQTNSSAPSSNSSTSVNPAMDWFSGDARDVRSYYSYGKAVLAVADGRVVTARDGLPNNIPGHGESF